jgi:hypothetical protein
MLYMMARTAAAGESIVFLGLDLRRFPPTAEVARGLGLAILWLGSVRGSEVQYINISRCDVKEKLNWRAITDGEIRTLRQVHEIAAVLIAEVRGFEQAYVNRIAPLLGVRRTRTIRCEYDITEGDVVDGRGFGDEVARFAWVDIAARDKNPAGGGSFGIPYRALLPLGVERLLVAGRMITSDFEAHMATRNTVCCMSQGEAAGTAAALAWRLGVTPRALDVQVLQDTLERNGVRFQRSSR